MQCYSVGACFSGKGRIDKKDGLTKDGDINIGYGLYFSGQINAKLGFGETKKIQQKGTDEWRFDANLGSLASSKLGVGGSFSRNKNTRDWELSIGVGPYTGTWSKTNNNINYSYSLGQINSIQA